ncbi:hypothetical protein PR048_013538 [Dryococelus australis]|uniref:Uncharacterized protein n=1 Tax=Dryococelus australis TaxID=614101 RepID=A0ABQ9HSG7_9NEOP|nr:hypothetical protein PR048_013538 [Dryococelus australis]
MVCIDGQPFSKVKKKKKKGFNDLIKLLEPHSSTPSRKHSAKEIIPAMYTKVMGRIKEVLHTVKFLGITTDIWTSVSYDDYISLTIHYLDTNFCLHHCCLEVVPFSEVCHTVQNICQFLTNFVRDWCCHKKLLLSLETMVATSHLA